jgi:flagellar biosynthesis protein
MRQINKRAGRKGAVALRYQPEKRSSPYVTAQGRGLLAERLIEEAKQYGIPIRENPDLVQILLELDLGQEIPPTLYKAVAEILLFVYRLNEEWKKSHGVGVPPPSAH